ncbi:Hypothetical protein I5071_59980 [Sandaracinus amylolyticus]|nr:Hypothetical protein I5071_59980 [Sandaracinus amylolyticus]
MMLALTACTSAPGALPGDGIDAGSRRRDASAPIDGATERDVGPRVDGGDPFTTFDRAWWERAVIYFVMVDRFSNGDRTNDGDATCTDASAPILFHGGDLQGIVDRLDYLEELGVTAVWITPVQRQVGRRGDQCGYHGYWADLGVPDDGAIEPRLGGEAALHALIDALHERGMRLIVDLVVNHAGYGARVVGQRPEWFHPSAGCETLGDPDVYCALSGLPDFAHERDDVADYLDAMSTSFVSRFAFDGIRMDTVKHVEVAYFRDRWVPAVREERPGLYLVGELFDEGGYALFDRYLDAGFDGLFDFPMRRALIDSVAHGGSLGALAGRAQETVTRWGAERARLRATMIDNHDVPRFVEEMSGASEAEKSARLRLALGVLFTVPGIPQLYMGDELGMGGAYPLNRRDMPAWTWRAEDREGAHEGALPDAARIHDEVRALARLRASTPALHAGGYQELWRPAPGGANAWAFFRSSGESRVVVAVNGGATTITDLQVPYRTNPGIAERDRETPDGTTLTLVHGPEGASARVVGGRIALMLPPRSLVVLTMP